MKIKTGYKVRTIAGENVLVVQGTTGIDLTRVIVLNDTAAWLFNRMKDTSFTQEEVAKVMTDRYEVDLPTALGDAQKWIDNLSVNGVIDV